MTSYVVISADIFMTGK